MRNIGLLVILILTTTGCSRGEQNRERVTVRINSPSKALSQSLDTGADFSTKGDFGLPDPLTTGDVDCFGIFVTYPELSAEGSCTDVNGAVVAQPNEMFGMFPNGGAIEISVLAGENREFTVFGFSEGLGFCPSINQDFSNIEINLSHPIFLGTATETLTSGANTVNIVTDFNNAFRIDDCTGPLFDQFDGTGNGTFNPSSISGLIGWYDPADNSKVFADSGCTTPASAGSGNIGCIKDKSGSNNHATQATGTNQPFYTAYGINGRHAVNYLGDDFLDLGTGIQERVDGTYIVVFDFTNDTAGNQFLLGASASGVDGNRLFINPSEGVSYEIDTSSQASSVSTLNTGTPELTMLTWESTGGVKNLYINNPNTPDQSATAAITITPAFNVFMGCENNNGTPSTF